MINKNSFSELENQKDKDSNAIESIEESNSNGNPGSRREMTRCSHDQSNDQDENDQNN